MRKKIVEQTHKRQADSPKKQSLFEKWLGRNKTQLQKVLEKSENAAKEGYSAASQYVKEIDNGIKMATQIIEDCVDDLNAQHINDEKIIVNVKLSTKIDIGILQMLQLRNIVKMTLLQK